MTRVPLGRIFRILSSSASSRPICHNNGGEQVTLLLSEQDVNLVGDNLEGKENAATKLIRVIIAIAF